MPTLSPKGRIDLGSVEAEVARLMRYPPTPIGL